MKEKNIQPSPKVDIILHNKLKKNPKKWSSVKKIDYKLLSDEAKSFIQELPEYSSNDIYKSVYKNITREIEPSSVFYPNPKSQWFILYFKKNIYLIDTNLANHAEYIAELIHF